MWRDTAHRLPPGSFSFVMATGILSTALSLTGVTALSVALLVIAVAGLVVLTGLSITRILRFRQDVAADLRDPGRAFGFFTIVAALDVVAVRLFSAGLLWPAAVLGALSVPVWFALNYSVPTGLFLRTRATSAPLRVGGSWLLWVVGTQALTIIASITATKTINDAIAGVAVALWGIGVALYLIITILIVHQLLTVRNLPETFSPTYWILMGATAITVLAAAHILQFPHTLPILTTIEATVSGISYLLWALGAWWIPFLVIFGLWRHAIHRVPLRYSTALWSIVFPLGMYSTASLTLGSTVGLTYLIVVGQIGTAIAAVAWLAVTASACHAAIRAVRA